MIRIILDQAARIRELEEKVKVEQQKRNAKFAKPSTTKKPGQKLGHVGMTRAMPDHIDAIIEETLKCYLP